MPMRIFIADDEPGVLQEFQTFFELRGCSVIPAPSVERALSIIRDLSTPFDVAILDKVFPEEAQGGLHLLREIRRLRPHVQCMVVTAFPDVAASWQYMNMGAFTYEKRTDRKAILDLVTQAYALKEGVPFQPDLGVSDMWALAMPAGRDELALVRSPLPRYRGGEIVAKARFLGVCGTDVGTFAGKSDNPNRDYPLIEFHEAVGEVVAKGADVPDDLFALGDWVVPVVRRCQKWVREPGDAWDFHLWECDHWHDCPSRHHPDMCPRRPGYLSRGTGKYHGFGSQYFSDAAEHLIRVTPQQREKLGRLCVLTEPLSVSWKAIREVERHRPFRRLRDQALIVGAGPIGLLCAAILVKMYPGVGIAIADLGECPAKSDLVARNFAEAVRFIKVQRGADWPKEIAQSRFDVSIDASGDIADVFPKLCEVMNPESVIALLSVSDARSRDATVSLKKKSFDGIVTSGIKIVGSVCASRDDMENSLRFMHERCDPALLGDLVWPAPVCYDRAVAAIGCMERTREYIKIVVECE